MLVHVSLSFGGGKAAPQLGSPGFHADHIHGSVEKLRLVNELSFQNHCPVQQQAFFSLSARPEAV